jgi:uncharacterized protein YukE
MTGEFIVDPDRMEASGQVLGASGDQLHGEISRLEAELASFGAAWGDDDLGSLIGLAYQEIRDAALDCLYDNVTELTDQAQGVRDMAAAFRDTDAAIATDLFDDGR